MSVIVVNVILKMVRQVEMCVSVDVTLKRLIMYMTFASVIRKRVKRVFVIIVNVMLVVRVTVTSMIITQRITRESKETGLITHHVTIGIERLTERGRTNLISEETTATMKAGYTKDAIEDNRYV